MLEIERKFLVHSDKWDELQKNEPLTISQGYISDQISGTVRVRIKNDRAYLTLKGKNSGITRNEFEYEIPYEDGEAIMEQMCSKVLKKKRYEIQIHKHVWEVDVFEGALAPLIVAEIELQSEGEEFHKPEWIAEEVSDDPSYYNSNLIKQL